MSYIYVTTEEESRGLAAALSGSRRFALDCEAAGFHRYSDRLCLLQITIGSDTWIVDPLGFDPAPLLRGPLEDPEVEIVMHGADYDLRLLLRDLGIGLRGLFDTQIAAALLGLDGLGLAAQLAERFDVKLSKKYQRADWADRPLTDGMLEYAADDTRYLLELGDQMRAELGEAGRLAWAEEECRALEDAALAGPSEEEPIDPVTKIKGARDLSPRQVHALRVALEWREEIARERDRATFRVVGNEPLVDAVAAAPTRTEELAGIKGFPGGLARNEGKELLRRLQEVGRLDDAEIVPYPRRRGGPGRPPPEVEEVAERLKTVRNKRAESLGLERGTLLSNAVILEAARTAPATLDELGKIDGMRSWKLDLLGEAMLAEIARG